ncbi:MAG TPA: hypothetical protein VNY73_05145 [Bacteroidia bacterium]|nr:hypothetical protein [Bacteroidia bacterium]
MKRKTAYKTGVWILSLLLCLFIFEKLFDFGVRHNLNLKLSYVSATKIDADLLVLGPCEPLWMVSPEILSEETALSCYNLANSHSDFADNYLHLSLYLKSNKAPKYLLLFVTPESFDTNYNTFYSYRFSAFLNDTLVSKTVAECDRDFYAWSKVPFMKYGYYSHQAMFLALQGWKHYFSKKPQPYYPDGFEPPARIVWDNHYDNLKKLYPKGYTLSWSPLREKYLQKIIDLCRQSRIEVTFYESPILKEVTDYQYNRALYVEKIAEIATKNSVPFLQFEHTSWAADRKYFISPMVTTLQGSYLFSGMLGRRFKELKGPSL